MKYLTVLTCVLLTAFASPSFAQDNNKTCAAKADNIANTAERTAFLKSCLERRSAPANTAKVAQQRKEAQCNTNANNLKLDGKKKTDYLEHCYQENDFNPNQKPHPKN